MISLIIFSDASGTIAFPVNREPILLVLFMAHSSKFAHHAGNKTHFTHTFYQKLADFPFLLSRQSSGSTLLVSLSLFQHIVFLWLFVPDAVLSMLMFGVFYGYYCGLNLC